MIKDNQISERHKKFMEDRSEWTDREISFTQLYYLTRILDKAERTRANTSTMVWFLIVIPLIMGFFIFLLGGMSMLG